MLPFRLKSGRSLLALTTGLAVLTALISGAACSPRQTLPLQFFYLKHVSTEYKRVQETKTSISEKADYVVVANLPGRPQDSSAALLRFWSVFTNRARIERDFSAYRLWFFRESKSTPRDYVPSEAGYVEYDRIGDHTDDLVATIEWRRCRMRLPSGTWRLTFVQDEAPDRDSILRDDCTPADEAPLVSPARQR